MNKYFLPVYNSQLKPWIKWWILKRLGGGESTLKAVTLSEGTLTKVDKSMGLRIKEYYGNTVQNGTPTPELPIEIQTITGNNTFTINSNTYSLDLGNIELCKIDEYQDRLYKENDKWYIEKQVDKIILNGRESWYGGNSGAVSTNYTYVFTTKYDNLIKKGYYVAYCNRMKNLNDIMSINTLVTTDTIAIGDPGNSNRIRIMILTSRLSSQSITALKNWLSSNNLTVYYVLDEVTTTEITDTNLISQLNGLYEFYVQSSTVSISNDSEIPFEFLLEYYGR